MAQVVCNPGHGAALLAALYLADTLFEYWLGKTGKFKASSKVELVTTAVALVVIAILKRKDNGNRN